MFTTIHTSLNNLNKVEKSILDEVMFEYCQEMRFRFKNKQSKIPLSEKDYRNSNFITLKNKEVTRICRRYGRSIDEEIDARIDSLIECRKDDLKNKKNKLSQLNKKIEKHKIKKENAIKNGLNVFLKNNNKTIDILHKSKDKLEAKIAFLLKEIENPKICFGSAKLFKEQFKAHVTHSDWYKKWVKARNDFFYLSGAKDENCGNSVMQLSINLNNNFDLKITLPRTLQEKYGKYLVLKDIHIPNSRELRTIIHNLETFKINKKNDIKSINNGKPLTFLMKRKGYRYNLHISYDAEEKDVFTNDCKGVIGVDINPTNLSFTEIDNKGNRLYSKVINLKFRDHGTGFRQTQIDCAVNEIIEYAIKTKKTIILEELDFKNKKLQLTGNSKRDKKLKRMLHRFPYAKVIERFTRNSALKGVNIHYINPSYTSLLGAIKFQKILGISIHEAASYVIARKFYKFKEKVKSPLLSLIVKARKTEVKIPEDIFLLQERDDTKFLKSLYDWYQKKHKEILKERPLKTIEIIV